MNSNSDVTSDAKCRHGFRAVSEITVKTLANYLKLDYESLAEEDLLELATFLQTTVGTKMLGFTEKEVGHMTLKKWSLLYKHFRAYHNFCTQQQLFKDENSNLKDNDEWLPD